MPGIEPGSNAAHECQYDYDLSASSAALREDEKSGRRDDAKYRMPSRQAAVRLANDARSP